MKQARDYIDDTYDDMGYLKRAKRCSFKRGVLAGILAAIGLFAIGVLISGLIYV